MLKWNYSHINSMQSYENTWCKMIRFALYSQLSVGTQWYSGSNSHVSYQWKRTSQGIWKDLSIHNWIVFRIWIMILLKHKISSIVILRHKSQPYLLFVWLVFLFSGQENSTHTSNHWLWSRSIDILCPPVSVTKTYLHIYWLTPKLVFCNL